MTTVRAIAEEANVSISTVSLALNGKPRISLDTRNRVLSAAKKVGYRISDSLQQTIPVKKWCIGIIYPKRVVVNGGVTSLCREWMRNVRSAVADDCRHLIVFGGSENVDRDIMFQNVIADGELDAVILIGVSPEDGYLDKIVSLGLPAVVFNRKASHGEFSVVGVDNYGAGVVISKFWSSLGHRKLAMLYNKEPMTFAIDYKEGIEKAISGNQELVFKAGFDEKWSDCQLEEICKAVIASGATAVSVLGDLVAVRCIDIWTRLGVRVPEELSVIGYDDLDVKTANGLRCSSVGYDKVAMGDEAGKMLLELLREGSELKNSFKIFKTKVVERDTTAPARH